MDTVLVLAISILLQSVAIVLSLRLIPVTRTRTAWVLMAISFSLIALRQLITMIDKYGDSE